MNKGAPYGQTCGLSNVEMKHVGELANIVLLSKQAGFVAVISESIALFQTVKD